MSIPEPASFLDAIAGGLVFAAVAMALLSLLKPGALKLSGMTFVAGLALASANWFNYFAAIFIVATAITELSFLEKLAAIMRGSKEYFDYQKETLTVAEVKQRAVSDSPEESLEPTEEVTEQEAESVEQERIGPTIPRANRRGATMQGVDRYAIEQLALDFLEKEQGPLERGLRFKGKSVRIEVDALVSDDTTDTLIEVKSFLEAFGFANWLHRALPELLGKKDIYSLLTGRPSRMLLLIVVPDVGLLSAATQRALTELSLVPDAAIHVVDFEQIGYKLKTGTALPAALER